MEVIDVAYLTSDQQTMADQQSTEYDDTFIDLSSTSSFGTLFQNVDSIEFRINLWGANGDSENFSRMNIDQLAVEGVIPEPVYVAYYNSRSWVPIYSSYEIVIPCLSVFLLLIRWSG